MSDFIPSKLPARLPEGGGSALRLFSSVLRGSLGFAAVSVAGFSAWAFAGKWLYTNVGETGLYLACLMVFLGTSGLALHPLVCGPQSLGRFYRIFIPAFGAYALAWSAAWFALRFGWGEWLGSLAGSLVFAAMVARGFGNFRSFVKVAFVVFVLHSAGYFFGGSSMRWLTSPPGSAVLSGLSKPQASAVAKLSWGLFYGLGFGAGLGCAFFTFQLATPGTLPNLSARSQPPTS